MEKKQEIRAFTFKPSLLVELEVLDLNMLKIKSNLFEGYNKAKFFQLIWVSSGELRLDVDFMPVHVYEGELFLISINQVYGFNPKSSFEGKLILFTSDFFSYTKLDSHLRFSSVIFNPLYLNPIVRLGKDFVEPLVSLLEVELKKQNDFFQEHIAHSFLRILLLEIERSLHDKRVMHIEHTNLRLGRLFCEAVGDNFREHHNINFYQDLLAVSEKALAKEVKEFTGMTPKEYIDARLILEAKRILSFNQDLSIKEVGFELGFDEPTNFNKFFKKKLGTTPNEFRLLQNK